MDKKKKSLQILIERHQSHIIEYFNNLSTSSQESFLTNLDKLNLKLVFELYDKEVSSVKESKEHKNISPPTIFKPYSSIEKVKLKKAGETSISNGDLAVVIVAGGEATRLKYPHPKGMYPISPLQGKSLFQLFSEKVKALSLKYNVDIPLLFMTNPKTVSQIETFFSKHNFFDLNPNNIFFFQQELLPSITSEGKLITKKDGSILTNPDGHGGTIKSLWESKLVHKLEKRGVKMFFYCHIDNPLVNVLDPLFVGCHLTNKADFSLKTIKKYKSEKVGTLVNVNGKPIIIEYIELPAQLQKAVDKKGNLIFNSGSIGIHIINTDFIKSLNENGFALPYHKQEKRVSFDGKEIDVWKFETFFFDAIPLAKRICCIETRRQEEFAPLKNYEGKDSPIRVKEQMVKLYKKWLLEANIKVPDNIIVEISPLFATDKDEFISKIDRIKPVFTKDTYLN